VARYPVRLPTRGCKVVRSTEYARPRGENAIRRVRNFAHMRGMTFACTIQVSYMVVGWIKIAQGTNLACEVLDCTDGKSMVDFANVRGKAVCTFERLFCIEERIRAG